MLAVIRAASQFVDRSIGWNRVGIALSLTIIGGAVFVLYRMLEGLDLAGVGAGLSATPWTHIALAGLFVALGYFTLTFYDWFALRTIGRKDVPYRVAALAGFTSYSVGHNVGASVVTGGAVRYRIYSSWHLSAVEVAKVIFIAGLTFWLGNAAMLGLGISWAPEAASSINQLPPWLNRTLALVTLAVLAGYVWWVWQRPRLVGRQGWQVTLPGGRLTLLQIFIGIVDLTFCALAMYMLLPAAPEIGFVELAVIFISATLLGFASHSPGGLGVFDAAMLVGLWHFEREPLIAALLIFRLLYYIIPFGLALATLGLRELVLTLSRPAGTAAAGPAAAAPAVASTSKPDESTRRGR